MRNFLEDFKKDIKSNTLIIRDFTTPLSIMDRYSKQRINKDIVALNNTLEQMDSINICTEAFTPKKQNIFFSNAHEPFSKIGHTVGHKTSINKFKKIEIISSIFLDQNGSKLDIKLKGKIKKTFKYMETE